jgi:NADH dehydrogenase [ubiquinone] 1 alpha subcomplex assembly factor 1
MSRFFRWSVTLASLVIVTAAVINESISTAAADEPKGRVLFDFSQTEASRQWQTVNDGVMGGRSDGRFSVAEKGTMEFLGTLSLANNGGFASVRSRTRALGLKEGDTLVARVKGDGRRYTLNLYVPRRRMAFSYRVEFQTKKDEWIEVRAPLKDFVATSFGRTVKNARPVGSLDVNSLGFLLGDKKAGPFKLEVDWIKAEQAPASDVQ